MLRTKSIITPAEQSDGLRISIMSRHTLNDGITPNPDIKPESYDEWWPQLAPPQTLLGSYYKRGLSWEDFQTGYIEHIRQAATAAKIAELINLAKNNLVTVLCIETSPEFCHRRLLAEECLLVEPELEINIE